MSNNMIYTKRLVVNLLRKDGGTGQYSMLEHPNEKEITIITEVMVVHCFDSG